MTIMKHMVFPSFAMIQILYPLLTCTYTLGPTAFVLVHGDGHLSYLPF